METFSIDPDSRTETEITSDHNEDWEALNEPKTTEFLISSPPIAHTLKTYKLTKYITTTFKH